MAQHDIKFANAGQYYRWLVATSLERAEAFKAIGTQGAMEESERCISEAKGFQKYVTRFYEMNPTAE
jgi:hypothetical protein